ncbi:beta-L-arabinofuranosidase domain-containing protein [Streptomyces sp. NPDC056987]|uniref:beta-L-arabinofuranosidase domain-containing protein n=1 Tax=Streptomyces sp. NPDC056987 TaxID=3345988 RepID=UPI003641F368
MTRARPFALRDVDLLDGVHSRTRDQMLHLARVFPVDRVLAVFRANAGLDTRGALPPGTWEDFGHPDERAWSEADYPGPGVAPTASLLRGHYAGHFLSMLSLSYASTGEELLRDKADETVAGLAEVRDALAATGRYSHPGFLAAYGEWQFSRLEDMAPYGEIWAPYYTCHKIMAGLLDAYEQTGSRQALEIATGMGHWVAGRILRLDRARLQRMWSLYIAGEFGGMNETMTRLHRITGEASFLRAAGAFEVDRVLDAAVAGRDVLDGMHANQHLPMLVGHLDQYDATGERRYLDAVVALWDQIVPGRTFAHGGTGEGELWGPADTVAGFVKRRNAETCATYNLLKIARSLFGHTLDRRYADYAERASLNHIVGSRADVTSDTSPEVLYMYPVDPGALREYDNVGTCCGGTGLESHVKHQESVWFHAPGQLYVTSYVPSRLRHADGEVTLRTRYPRDGKVAVEFGLAFSGALHLRIPPWAAAPRIDGVETPVPAAGFVTLRRDFRPGDIVELDLPMPLRLVPTPDDPTLVSVELGPTVLLARDDATTTLPVAAAAHRRLDGTIAGHTTDGDLVSVLGRTFEPAWSGGAHRHHMYLRLADPEIAFLGSAPGVPDRQDADGWSFLTGLWADGGYADVAAFFTAVHRGVVRAARSGLLSRDEAALVLLAAAASTLDGPAVPRRGVVGPDGADPVRVTRTVPADGRSAEDVVAWSLPADIGAGDPLPVVRLEVTGDRAPSGWYTREPGFAVTSLSPATLEAAVGEGVWRPATGVIALDREGHHVLRGRATDPSGRTVHATREVAVDTRPPSVRAEVRPLGPSNVEVTLHADDEVSGVDRVQWRTPETFWGVYQEPFTRALREEPQILEFIATDRAGNTTPVQRVALPPLP